MSSQLCSLISLKKKNVNLIGGFVEEVQFDLHPVVGQKNKLKHFMRVDLNKIKSIVSRVKQTYCGSDPFLISDVKEC